MRACVALWCVCVAGCVWEVGVRQCVVYVWALVCSARVPAGCAVCVCVCVCVCVAVVPTILTSCVCLPRVVAGAWLWLVRVCVALVCTQQHSTTSRHDVEEMARTLPRTTANFQVYFRGKSSKSMQRKTMVRVGHVRAGAVARLVGACGRAGGGSGAPSRCVPAGAVARLVGVCRRGQWRA